MMRIEGIGLLRSLLLAVVLGSGGTALSQVNISGPRTLNMPPGETRTVEYTLTNFGEETVEASIFFNDYAQQADGSLVHVPARSLPQSLFNVARFTRLEYVLPPGASVEVPLSIGLPDDASGGYWGVVGVETPAPPAAEEGNAVVFNVRYAMVTSLEVDGAVERGVTIDNIAPSPQQGGVAVALTIRSTGTGYQRYDLSLVFEGENGISKAIETQSVVLPGLTVDLVVPVPEALPPGSYGIFATLTHPGGRADAVGTVTVGQ